MDYQDALKLANEASAKFRAVQLAYRSRQIGDAEFLAAQAEYKKSEVEFDAAFSAEQDA